MPGPSSLTSSTSTVVAAPDRDEHRAARRRVPGGVVEQVEHDLLQPVPVADDRAVGRRHRVSKDDVAAGARGDDLASATTSSTNGPPGTRSSSSRCAPASIRDRSSSSVTSRPSRSVWASAVRSVAGSGSATPSTMFSSTACSAVIGVRSSCDTLAISSRRCWSAAARSAAIWLNALGQLADLVARGGPDPPGVVAPGHRPGRRGHLAQRPGHAVREHLRGQQGQPDRDRGRARRDPADADPEEDQAGQPGGHHEQAELQLDRAHRIERAGQDRRSAVATARLMPRPSRE